MIDTFIVLQGVGAQSPLLFTTTGFWLLRMVLAPKEGAGPADGDHTQIRVVLVLSDHVWDAAQGGPMFLLMVVHTDLTSC